MPQPTLREMYDTAVAEAAQADAAYDWYQGQINRIRLESGILELEVLRDDAARHYSACHRTLSRLSVP